MKEIWKPIVGFEGQYEVSNRGRVRSYRRSSVPQILKAGRASNGYFTVALGRDCTRLVHRLVAQAFLQLQFGKPEVMHLDGTRINNCVTNLRWGDRSDNNFDKRNHRTDLNGEKHSHAKLTDEKVRYIRVNPNGCTQRELAKQFGVSQTLICIVMRRERWIFV